MKPFTKTKKIIALSIALSLTPTPAFAWELNDLLKPKVIASILLSTTALYLIYNYFCTNNNANRDKSSRLKQWPALTKIDPSTDRNSDKSHKNADDKGKKNASTPAASPNPVPLQNNLAPDASPQSNPSMNHNYNQKKNTNAELKKNSSSTATSPDTVPLQSQCAVAFTVSTPSEERTASNTDLLTNAHNKDDKKASDKPTESAAEPIILPNVLVLSPLPVVQPQIPTQSNKDIPQYSAKRAPRNGLEKYRHARRKAKKHRSKPYKLASQQKKGLHRENNA